MEIKSRLNIKNIAEVRDEELANVTRRLHGLLMGDSISTYTEDGEDENGCWYAQVHVDLADDVETLEEYELEGLNSVDLEVLLKTLEDAKQRGIIYIDIYEY